MPDTTPWFRQAMARLMQAGYSYDAATSLASEVDRLRLKAKPLLANKPGRNHCACGRPFYNRAGMINHGNTCLVEVRRSEVFVDAIQQGHPLDATAQVQLPFWDAA